MGEGSVVVGQGNFIGIVATFNFAMFVQHMHFETFVPLTFELTDLTLKLELLWGGGIFIGHIDLHVFFYVGIDHGFHFFSS